MDSFGRTEGREHFERQVFNGRICRGGWCHCHASITAERAPYSILNPVAKPCFWIAGSPALIRPEPISVRQKGDPGMCIFFTALYAERRAPVIVAPQPVTIAT